MTETLRSPGQVAILVPAFGAADKLRVCLQSLRKYAPSWCSIFVLDDGTPDDSIAEICREQAQPNLAYVRRCVNRGFVDTCNWGWKQVAPAGADLLLLNSDTEVTPGFLEEMLRILYLNERHGVVTPRSNNATIFSIPSGAPDVSPDDSFSIWKEIMPDLPAYALIPTAVGFCMLIKGLILEHFGLFDEIYSPGYNEENDFVCRINRYGYSAVVANHAFVFHHEASSFGPRRKALEAAHRKVLLDRYPEYERKIENYLSLELDPVEKFAILRRKHRPAMLFDLFHLPAKHCGSSEFALNLLREVYTQTCGEWDWSIGVSEATRFFFAGELNGYRVFDDRPGSSRLFDLGFKACQIFTWDEFRRLNRLTPKLSFVLQDIIAVRCDYLTSTDRKTIFSKTVQLADRVFTISDFSHSDFEAFFGIKFPSHTIHHGTNAGRTASEMVQGDYVLVVGNSFAHKGVKEAVKCLTNVGPVRVLGGEKPNDDLPDQIRWETSGNLTRGYMRELYARASLLVYPSHYEGYGLPIIEALALGKPVVALDNQLNRELSASLANDGLSLIRSVRDLQDLVTAKLRNGSPSPVSHLDQIRRWSDVAKDYVASFRDLLEQPPDAEKLRARSDLVRVLNSGNHP